MNWLSDGAQALAGKLISFYLRRKFLSSYRCVKKKTGSDRLRVVFSSESHSRHYEYFFARNYSDAHILRAKKRSSKVIYNKPDRFFNCFVTGLLLDEILPSSMSFPKLDILLVAYGMDTYDAQLLRKKGYTISVQSIDVGGFIANKPSWKYLKAQKKYTQADARKLSSFIDGTFDLILFSRAGIDLMGPDDFTSVWNQAYVKLKPEGVMLSTIISFEWGEKLPELVNSVFVKKDMKVCQTMNSYKTSIGEFQIGGLGKVTMFDSLNNVCGVDLEKDLREFASNFNKYGFREGYFDEYNKYFPKIGIKDLNGAPDIKCVDFTYSFDPAYLGVRSTLCARKV